MKIILGSMLVLTGASLAAINIVMIIHSVHQVMIVNLIETSIDTHVFVLTILHINLNGNSVLVHWNVSVEFVMADNVINCFWNIIIFLISSFYIQ